MLDKAGIDKPIVPGIFPISNAKQIVRITELSGAVIPKKLRQGIEKYQDSPEDLEKFGTSYAVEQVEELLANGFHHFHFYTMNRHQQINNILIQLRKYFPNLNL